MTVFIVRTSGRSDASIPEGVAQLVSVRASARVNPGGGDGAGSGSGVRRNLCSDTELCAAGDEAGIPRRRAFWICRVTGYHSLDNRRIERG